MSLIDAERNWEETASDNTGYKLEYNDGIFALYDPQGAILCEFMPDLPTVYDIDKVVEELESFAKLAEDRWTNGTSKHAYQEHKCWVKAIEIVKQGGVSDDVCEWHKVKNGNAYKCNTHAEIHDSRVLDWCKCPYCGKKIKVVE